MEYTVLIESAYPDSGYIGQCKELPGAMSQGETVEELMENMKEAIELALEVQREQFVCCTMAQQAPMYRRLSVAV